MHWSLFLAPALFGFILGRMGEGRLRHVGLMALLIAPLVIVGTILLLGLGPSSDLLNGSLIVAPVIALWIAAAAVSYFAARRLAS